MDLTDNTFAMMQSVWPCASRVEQGTAHKFVSWYEQTADVCTVQKSGNTAEELAPGVFVPCKSLTAVHSRELSELKVIAAVERGAT